MEKREAIMHKATLVGLEYFNSRHFLPKMRKIYRVINDCYSQSFSLEQPRFKRYSEFDPDGNESPVIFELCETGIAFYPIDRFAQSFGMNTKTLKKHFSHFYRPIPSELLEHAPKHNTHALVVPFDLLVSLAGLHDVRKELESQPLVHRMAKIILS